VLLVKRCKKLPKETTKHWAHVVDARAGPGTKSLKGSKSKVESKSVKIVGKSAEVINEKSDSTQRKKCEHKKALLDQCDCTACDHNRQMDLKFKDKESRRVAERQQAKKSMSPKKFCAGSASASSSGHSSDSSKHRFIQTNFIPIIWH
jgi:hypothetical protein